MTRDEAVTLIKEGLGFKTSLDTTIKRRLQEAQVHYQMGKTLPKFLISEDATLSLLDGNQDVALPTRFLRVHEDDRIRYTPTDSDIPFFIPRKSTDDAISAYADADDAGPQVYALRKSTLRFYPIPDANYTLTWSFYQGGVALDAADVADNPWLVNAPYLFIGSAGLKIALILRDKDATSGFMMQKNEAEKALYGQVFDEETEGGPLIMSGEG